LTVDVQRSALPVSCPCGRTLAGIYEFWPDQSLPEDDPHRWLLSFTVLTATAQDSLGHVHDRAPVIVPPDMWADRLNPGITDRDVQELLDAIPEPVLTLRIVTER
jgi:putative SOS response-associated peptidase YedK